MKLMLSYLAKGCQTFLVAVQENQWHSRPVKLESITQSITQSINQSINQSIDEKAI